MKPIPLQPNLPTPTNCFGKPVPASQWYVCPNCKKESPLTKEWVGLTGDEILARSGLDCADDWAFDFARAIDDLLKEKNS